MRLESICPSGWPPARGYAHGMAGTGRILMVSGQVGADAEGHFPDDFAAQARLALGHMLAVVAAAGGTAEDVARMTWYVTDMRDYRSSLLALGPAYRAVMGRHYPAMTLVQVAGLVEAEARLEIEATAILPPA